MRIQYYTWGRQHITTITSGAQEPPRCVNIRLSVGDQLAQRRDVTRVLPVWPGCVTLTWQQVSSLTWGGGGDGACQVNCPHDDLLLVFICDPRPCGQPQSQPPCVCLSKKLQDQENGRSWMWFSLLQVSNFSFGYGSWKMSIMEHCQNKSCIFSYNKCLVSSSSSSEGNLR